MISVVQVLGGGDGCGRAGWSQGVGRPMGAQLVARVGLAGIGSVGDKGLLKRWVAITTRRQAVEVGLIGLLVMLRWVVHLLGVAGVGAALGLRDLVEARSV